MEKILGEFILCILGYGLLIFAVAFIATKVEKYFKKLIKECVSESLIEYTKNDR